MYSRYSYVWRRMYIIIQCTLVTAISGGELYIIDLEGVVNNNTMYSRYSYIWRRIVHNNTMYSRYS